MTGVVLGSNFFASSAKEEMSPAWMGFAVPLAVKRNNSKMMLEILNFMYHLHCKLNILWLSFVKLLQGKLYAFTGSLAI